MATDHRELDVLVVGELNADLILRGPITPAYGQVEQLLDDATLLLAECLIDVQAYNDARTTLRAFLRRFPDSPLVNDARTALSDLNLKR